MDFDFSKCNLCPRKCNANRTSPKGPWGFCGVPQDIYVARASLHMWEEPCISGKNGSGTVFFTGCNLGCIFCQNKDISKPKDTPKGKIVSINRLAEIFIEQQKRGAHNINLVTPTHYVPQIADAIIIAKDNGLKIPIVYNSSGYDSEYELDMLNGLVDVYLADFKYSSNRLADDFSKAKNYNEVAKIALDTMYAQVGKPKFIKDMLVKGMIVRLLILPNHLDDIKYSLTYLFNKYKNNIYYSIMNQYTPMGNILKYPELNRTVSDDEYDEILDFAVNLGIENAFIQEGETQSNSFIPDFNGEGV